MEQFIEIWSQARLDRPGTDRVYTTDDLLPQIARLEKNQERVVRNKSLASVIVLLALLILFLNRMDFALTSMLGIGIFAVSVLTIVIILNRLRFRITQDERSLPTMQMVSVSERKIHTERRIFTRYLPLFFLVALSGINLMYLETFSGEEATTRLIYHLVMSGSLLIAFILGLSVRIRRFQKQFHPLLERIRRFRDESRNSNDDGQ